MINQNQGHHPFPRHPPPHPPMPHHPLPHHSYAVEYNDQPMKTHVKAPEIDVSSGGLAIALVVCGIMLALERARNRLRA